MKKTFLPLICLVLLLSAAGCSKIENDAGIDQGEHSEKTALSVEPKIKPEDIPEGNGNAYEPEFISVEVRPQHGPAYGVSLRLPADWTYEVRQTDDDPTSSVTVSIRPVEPGTEGEITFCCSTGVFGVCGTGLEQKEIIFNGHEAWQGFYDGSSLWNFICLKDLAGCAIINSAGNWYEDYPETMDRILSSVEFLYFDF